MHFLVPHVNWALLFVGSSQGEREEEVVNVSIYCVWDIVHMSASASLCRHVVQVVRRVHVFLTSLSGPWRGRTLASTWKYVVGVVHVQPVTILSAVFVCSLCVAIGCV